MLLVSPSAFAQLAVHDPAVTARNTITAIVKEYILNTQREQHAQLRRMAQRLSLFTNLRKYAPAGPASVAHPWRRLPVLAGLQRRPDLRRSDGFRVSGSEPPCRGRARPSRSTQPGRSPSHDTTRLATLNLADATAIAATHDTGQLRFNGRKHELPAIDALEAHVIDPSNEQSATAVLDKISGAVLIGARQRQARGQLLAGVVEQLLVDSKRTRDADAAAMNMQLVTWRDGRAANHAFVAGTGDALRTWRQP